MATRAGVLLCAMLSASAFAVAQTGRVAADESGRVVLFESAARLAGEARSPGARILEFDNGETRVAAASSLAPSFGGVQSPHTNDYGDLRAYTEWRMIPLDPWGQRYLTTRSGVVRHARDGWQITRPGSVGLSRDGRWAAFSQGVSQATWIDLWTGEETQGIGGGGVRLDSIADDGSLLAVGQMSLLVRSPGAPAREFPLTFQPGFDVALDRTARFAAVSANTGGIWRVDLLSGQAEPWVTECSNCQVLDIATGGKLVLYRELSWLSAAGEPGSAAMRLSREGVMVDSASLTGDGRFAVATTADGIARYDLETLREEMLLAGPTSLTRMPLLIAPGMWLREEGRGTVAAEIKLGGIPVEPLERRSAAITWVVPADTPLGAVELEIAQPGSPFQPSLRTPEVLRAAPAFITQGNAGVGHITTAEWQTIWHADSGELVTGSNPARPGEVVAALMTGLNGLAGEVYWTLGTRNGLALYRPRFVSAEPHPGNAHWTLVRVQMPEALPAGISVLYATHGKAEGSALIVTADR